MMLRKLRESPRRPPWRWGWGPPYLAAPAGGSLGGRRSLYFLFQTVGSWGKEMPMDSGARDDDLLRGRSCRQSLARGFSIFDCEASSPVPLSRRLRSGSLRCDIVRCWLRSVLRLRLQCWVLRGDNKAYVAHIPSAEGKHRLLL